jgi:hypothetical protein
VETVNSFVNAIVQRDYENARRSAEEVDDYLSQLDKNSHEFRQVSTF